jgi:2-dehydro-3-deoxygluconokinase
VARTTRSSGSRAKRSSPALDVTEHVLPLRPADDCRWDLVALGEVMLRLDPGEGRISTARSFRVWEGGGEYNVARGLRRCFGLRSAIDFTERGFGVRAPAGCSDRANSAASQMRRGDVDWDCILGQQGARWLRCGGIFCALSESTAELAREAMEAARRHGTIVSYDLNSRPSLRAAASGRRA